MLSILVVTYNCSIMASSTIRGLLDVSFPISSVNLVIWNNGPKLTDENELISLRDKGYQLFLHQTIENRPLSSVYNEFVSMYQSEYYIILDHDSEIGDRFLSSAFTAVAEKKILGVPAITVSGKFVSPVINGVYSAGPYKKNDRLVAIGSGLLFSDRAVSIIREHYGNVFDTSFALYGVDTSFFIRIFQCGLVDQVVLLDGFSHSLSRLESEPKERVAFRNIERSYDVGITLRRYFSLYQLIYTVKVIIKVIIGRSHFSLIKIASAFISGKHPRCR